MTPAPYNERAALLEQIAQEIERFANSLNTYEKEEIALKCAEIVRAKQ